MHRLFIYRVLFQVLPYETMTLNTRQCASQSEIVEQHLVEQHLAERESRKHKLTEMCKVGYLSTKQDRQLLKLIGKCKMVR